MPKSGELPKIPTGEELDKTGMIIDFGEVKATINEYMDEWDHALVMPVTLDEDYLNVLAEHNEKLMIVNYNPTAENMARDIYETINDIFPNVSKVRLHETTTGWAEYNE